MCVHTVLTEHTLIVDDLMKMAIVSLSSENSALKSHDVHRRAGGTPSAGGGMVFVLYFLYTHTGLFFIG